MKERPILFSAPMVRAILDGRKTVTRRVVKRIPWRAGSNPEFSHARAFQNAGEWRIAGGAEMTTGFRCPHGQQGDRLWVRETWGAVSHAWTEDGSRRDWLPDRPSTPIRYMPFGKGYFSGHAIYAADGAFEWCGDDDGGGEPRSAWKPSIHMPRQASRITLEVTSVRVERLQDISPEQARSEGVESPIADHLDNAWIVQFERIWTSINGPDSWNANPWVWVVEFKRIAQPVAA